MDPRGNRSRRGNLLDLGRRGDFELVPESGPQGAEAPPMRVRRDGGGRGGLPPSKPAGLGSARRFARRAAEAGGALVLFAIAAAAATVAHGDLPATRRLVSRTATDVLAKSLLGRVEIPSVSHLGLDGLAVPEVRILAPEGHPVLVARGVRVEQSVIELALSAARAATGKMHLPLGTIHIGSLEVLLDKRGGSDTRLDLQRAIASREPADPSKPGRKMRVVIDALELGHAWLHGHPAGDRLVDADVDALRTAIVYDSEDGTWIDAQPFVFRTRALAPYDPSGEIDAHAFVPAEGASDAMRASSSGQVRVGEVPLSLSAGIDGERVQVALDANEISPEQLRSVVPSSPLRASLGVHASVRGTLPKLDVQALATAEDSSVAIRGQVITAPVPSGRLNIEATALDPRLIKQDAPDARFGASLDVDFALPPEGAQADVKLSTQPASWGEQPVPAIVTEAHIDQRAGVRGEGWVHEPGALVHATYNISPKGHVVVDADAKIPSLATQRRVKGAVTGAVDVTAHIELDDLDHKRLSARAKVKGRGVGAGANRTRSLDAELTASGPLDKLSLSSHLDARGVSVSNQKVDRVRLSTQGSLSQQKVDVTLYDPRFKVARASADVALGKGGGVQVRGLRARYENQDGEALVSAGSIELQGGRLSVRGLRLEGSAGKLEGDVTLDKGVTQINLDGAFDLAIASKMLGLDDLQRGTASIAMHVASKGREHKGEAVFKVRDVVATNADTQATLDAVVRFDGHEVSSFISGWASSTRAGTDVVAIEGNGLGRIDGELLSAGTWRGMVGELRQKVDIDLNTLFGNRLVRRFLIDEPSLPRARGKLSASLDVRRPRVGELPDVSLSLSAHELVIDVPTEEGFRGSKREALGVDVSLSTTHAEMGVAGEPVVLRADARVRDQRGTFLTAAATTIVDPEQLLRDVAAVRGAGKKATDALGRLNALPIAASISLPERAISLWPSLLRPRGVRGSLSGTVSLSGTAGDPRAEAELGVRDLIAVREGNVPSIDGKIWLRTLPDRIELLTAIDQGKRRVLDLGVSLGASVAQLVQTRSVDGVEAALSMRAQGLRLDAVPLVAQHGVRGALVGEVSMSGIGRQPEIKLDLGIEDGAMRDVKVPSARLQATASPDKPATWTLGMDGGDEGGRFDARGSIGVAFDRGLFPMLDRSQDIVSEFRAQQFEIAPLSPLVSGAVGEVGGKLDGAAKMRIKGHGDALSASDLEMDGSFHWTDGQIGIPQLEQTFKHGSLELVTTTRDDALLFAIRDISLSAYTGKVEGWAELSVGAGALFRKPPASPAEPVEPLPVRARAALRIQDKQKIAVTYQGAPLGTASGTIEIDIRPTADALLIHVAAPEATFDLPQTKKRKVQQMPLAPGVAVMDYVSPAELAQAQANAASLGKIVVHVGIGDDLATLMRGPSEPPKGELLIEQKELAVRANGRPSFEVTTQTVASGQIQTTGGRVSVMGKPFFVERGIVRFNGEPSNPELDVEARWDVADGTKVFVHVTGTANKPDVELRSDPAKSESAILNLILFGRESLNTPGQEQSDQGSAATGNEAAGLAASTVLNYLIDPIELFGQRFETKIDTTNGLTKLGVVTEIRPNLWAQVNVLAAKEVNQNLNVDTTEVLLDWRFSRNWSLRSSLGDRGSTELNLLWRHSY